MAALKAGVVGTGFMASAHIEAIRQTGMGDIVAISGSSREAVQKGADRFGVERTYDNFMSLIRDPDVQVIHNCTPNNLHFPVNRAAIAEGKHIVSEKPLTMTARESRLLISAIQRKAVVNAVVFNYRHYPAVAKLRKMVLDGDFGDVLAIHGSYLEDGSLNETDYDWRVDPEVGGPTRVVADIGSHWLDLACYVTGLTITEVVADFQIFLPVRKKRVSSAGTFGVLSEPRLVDMRVATEDYASVLLRFNSRARGTLMVSQMSAGMKNSISLQIDGSSKSVAWNHRQPDVLSIGHRERPNKQVKVKALTPKAKAGAFDYTLPGHGEEWMAGVTACMREIYGYIRDGKKPGRNPASFATFDDGYRMAVVVDKILLSSRRGNWIKTSLD